MAKHSFEQFNFQPFINQAISEFSFREPTDIQKKMIPLILKGQSAIGQSQTGTGKTHAYLLPIIERIKPELSHVQAVIFAPTRELASQIYEEAIKVVDYNKDHQIIVRNFTGGTDKKRSIGKLKQQPHIVIGTPGRLHDLVKEQALFVHQASMLVVDEADLTFDMGFIHDVDQVAGRMPEKLEIYVFSATIPEKLKPFFKKYMENPAYEQIDPARAAAEEIEHVLIPVGSRKKVDLLDNIMQSVNPYLGIVFANTKQMADDVADALIERGHKVGRLHGGLTPRERKRMMKQIRDLEYRFIIATDLAARGIDIPGVSHIINYEFPKELEFYIHRSGRTARAGNQGVSMALYDQSDEDTINRLEKMGIEFAHQDIRNGEWVDLPDRNRRKNRKNTQEKSLASQKIYVPKPKKVKPGYKKKRSEEIERMKKRARRMEKKNRK